MWRLIVSAILFFNGGLLLGGVLASHIIDDLKEQNNMLKKAFKKKDYLYVLVEESHFCSFEKGETLELIRDCRDGEGLFENEKGRTRYVDFDNVKHLTNSVKKL